MSTAIPNLKGVNIVLIGMMGAGKSTAGTVLAEMLRYQFFDTDTVIEQSAGRTINEIFAQSGELQFRALETQVLSELSSYRRLVVATGGGVVLDPMNWSYLRHGLVVWLNADIDTLWARLKQDDSRPLLQTANPYETLQEKLDQRLPLYQQADVTVDISQDLDVQGICQKILTAIEVRLREENPADAQADS